MLHWWAAGMCTFRSGSFSRLGIGGEQIGALRLRDVSGELAPGLGIDETHAVEEPVDLQLAAKEDAAQDQRQAARRMGFGVGERQRAAPGAAENHPLPDAEMLPQLLHVRHQMRRGVVAAGRRAGASVPRRAGRRSRSCSAADRRSAGASDSLPLRGRRAGTRPAFRPGCRTLPSKSRGGRRPSGARTSGARCPDTVRCAFPGRDGSSAAPCCGRPK